MRQLIIIAIGALILSMSAALADGVKGPSTDKGSDANRDWASRAVEDDGDEDDVDCDVETNDARKGEKVAANDDDGDADTDDEDESAKGDKDDDDSNAKDDDGDDNADDEDETDKKGKKKDGGESGGG